ncbi:hypothetical protein [Natrinema salinisoli]|uniref:hypothetical protein n=1 Tax=Natrinema salinisoli TaxID=2878535 RepID=UPI001CEFEE5C|nr:hypothetical protein [Natrinema salinisoli]
MSELQADLLKVDGEDHYFVAIPDRFWCEWMDERTTEESLVETGRVPPRTQFTKLPSFQTRTSKEEMIEALRDQKEYWELKACGEIAKELNNRDGSRETYNRYKQRATCCRDFLMALVDRPLPDDRTVNA